MIDNEHNYLPRFIANAGDKLVYILGDNNLVDRGYFITLRFRYNSKKDPAQYLTSTGIDLNWKHFINILNSKLLKSKYKNRRGRSRKEIPTVAILEEHCNCIKSNHIHLVMLKPNSISEYDFGKAVQCAWTKTYFGTLGTEIVQKNSPTDKLPRYSMFNFQKVFNRGIIPYVFKHKHLYNPYCIRATPDYKCAI